MITALMDPIHGKYIEALCIDIKLFHMCKYYLYDWIANSLEAEILCKQKLCEEQFLLLDNTVTSFSNGNNISKDKKLVAQCMY